MKNFLIHTRAPQPGERLVIEIECPQHVTLSPYQQLLRDNGLRDDTAVVRLASGSLLVRNVEPMITEEGEEIPARNTVGLYQIDAIPLPDPNGSLDDFIREHGTLLAQCEVIERDDWLTVIPVMAGIELEEAV